MVCVKPKNTDDGVVFVCLEKRYLMSFGHLQMYCCGQKVYVFDLL